VEEKNLRQDSAQEGEILAVVILALTAVLLLPPAR
jgi:hypothetical protein